MTIEDLMKRLEADETVNENLKVRIEAKCKILKEGEEDKRAMAFGYMNGCIDALEYIGKITESESDDLWKEAFEIWMKHE